MLNELKSSFSSFDDLVEAVRACTRCPRMGKSARVLNYSAGNIRAEVMFIGEAPGRLGADETEVPFHGDKSGRNFEDLLEFAGLNRADLFVTNAVLCNPKDEIGNNSTPNLSEASNCAGFLRKQIECVNPKIVVSLGSVALRSLAIVSPHALALATHVRTLQSWFGRYLVPLYHPGQRAMIHRSFANQRSDYQFVAEQWHRLSHSPKRRSGKSSEGVLRIARRLLAQRGEVSYFELHKLAYLVEYFYVKNCGRRATSAYFIRQKDGPYCTDLQLDRIKRADSAVRVSNQCGTLVLSWQNLQQPDLFGGDDNILSPELERAIQEVVIRYANRSESELKTAVYLTGPMRYILRREQHQKINLYNAPIDFLAGV